MAFLRDRSIFCIPESLLSYDERRIIGGKCIFTASLGFTGAALQLRSLRQFRNRQRRQPSPNPDIIFYLALSDLIACAGVFTLAICLMVLETPIREKHGSFNNIWYKFIPRNSIYMPIGTTIEVITLFGYLASYIWTFSYALDMCFQIYRIQCPMIVYHILAWAVPFELVTIIETVNFSLYPDSCERGNARLSRAVLSYAPVMIIMLANPILFIITFNRVKHQLRSSGIYTDVDRAALKGCRRKFFWMVVVFSICWLPNIITVSYFIWTFKKDEEKKFKLDTFWYFEAFVNPLQGIFNYFLYRRAFRVTATDTRPEPNSLPRVTVTPSLDKRSSGGKKLSKTFRNRTLQRVTASTSSQDEESPLIRPQNESSGPRYVYISRLLGE